MNAKTPIYPQPCVKFHAPILTGYEHMTFWGWGIWYPNYEDYHKHVPF